MAGMGYMREYVMSQYGGGWPDKVKKMPDYQVAAIYHDMMRAMEKARRELKNPKPTETEVRGGLQLSFFEGDHSMKIKEEYLR